MPVRVRSTIAFCAVLTLLVPGAAAAQIPGWLQRSFSLEQIDKDNFKDLRIAWRLRTDFRRQGPGHIDPDLLRDARAGQRAAQFSALGHGPGNRRQVLRDERRIRFLDGDVEQCLRVTRR